MVGSLFGLGGSSGKGGQDKNVPGWERDLVSQLAQDAVRERRRARRWGVFFKLLLFVYLFTLLILYWPDQIQTPGAAAEHTALVEVQGIIADGAKASADNVVEGLRDAFKDKKTKGVILRINSPGGSAVQAGYIYDEVKRLREKHADTPVYAVITDVCASGGYYIASAADKIFADKASVVGSIGVRMDSFGFVEAIEKLGIERRLLIAGEHKGLLDPFLPIREEEISHVRALLDEIHQQFIDQVKEGRGDRLTAGDEVFSGLIWTGEQSLELGLVDELGSSGYVAREVVGAEEIKEFTAEPDFLERLAERLGMATGHALASRLGIGSVRME